MLRQAAAAMILQPLTHRCSHESHRVVGIRPALPKRRNRPAGRPANGLSNRQVGEAPEAHTQMPLLTGSRGVVASSRSSNSGRGEKASRCVAAALEARSRVSNCRQQESNRRCNGQSSGEAGALSSWSNESMPCRGTRQLRRRKGGQDRVREVREGGGACKIRRRGQESGQGGKGGQAGESGQGGEAGGAAPAAAWGRRGRRRRLGGDLA